MQNQSYISLSRAASLTGKSKSVISQALKSGKISYISKDSSGYKIDPSELFRVFSKNEKTGRLEQDNTPPKEQEQAILISKLQAELEASRKEVSKLESDKEDYKNRLNEESEERRKLTMMIADQREKPPKKPVEQRKKFLGII